MRRIFALAAVLTCAGLPLGARADDPRSVPLVDQRGVPFRLADLRGRPSVVTFVATRCTDACPLANGEFAALATRLHRDGVKASLVTITLDPDFDTPYIMSGAARVFAANPAQWRLASGRPADVRRLMRSFGVMTTRDRHGVPDTHTSFAYVLDGSVRLARTLLLSTNLPTDAEAALRTVSGSERLTNTRQKR